MGGFDLIYSLKLLPGIVLGLTVHEFSHAYIAKICGDSTSSDQGRVTLNPLKHIDIFGFIMLFVVGFGWAKPVQFNEQNLRNPGRDIIKIAISGPLSNAILAMILSVIFAAAYRFSSSDLFSQHNAVWDIFIYAISINWGLFVFNLIPLPPLDGSHILFSPFRKHPHIYEVLYKYGTWILFGLVMVSILAKINLLPIMPVIGFFRDGFLGLLGI